MQLDVIEGVGLVLLFALALLMLNWWVGKRRADALMAISDERGVVVAFEDQEPYSTPQFARLRPGDKDKQYAIHRESMSEHISWPDDEDAVFVVSIKFHEPGSLNIHPSLRARTYARVRLPADVPNMRFGRAGFKLNRDWLHQPFGHWQDRFGARLPAQTLTTGDPEVDKHWIITAADPARATEALTDGVRRWLIDVAQHRTVAEARSEVEMETKDGWLLCDVGPTSLPMERRLEWLGWAKNAAQRLSGATE